MTGSQGGKRVRVVTSEILGRACFSVQIVPKILLRIISLVAMNQYKWDGTEDVSSIFSYSHRLGPRDAMQYESGDVFIMPFTKQDAQDIVQLHRLSFPSVINPEADSKASAEDLRQNLILNVDNFLSSIPSRRWFVKTNRHSCKDSSLDHPLCRELELFAHKLSHIEVPSLNIPLESLDFGSAFEAMCIARLQATAVTDGASTVSLLERSKRIHDDLSLQLEICPDPWDCYLAFSTFDEEMAKHPLHEFRCHISRRKLRCITQYSYLVCCPIPSHLMPRAVQAMALCVERQVLPLLGEDIWDAAVDVQCVPHPSHPLSFAVRIIEVNPLGPGSVWGHLHWERDKMWLLSDAIFSTDIADVTVDLPQQQKSSGSGGNVLILPRPCRVSDNLGGERCIEWYSPIPPASSTKTTSENIIEKEDEKGRKGEGKPIHYFPPDDNEDGGGINGRRYELMNDSLVRQYIDGSGDHGGYCSSISPLCHRHVMVVLYTTKHPLGLNFGALAHMPSDYLIELWNKWQMDDRPLELRREEEDRVINIGEATTSSSSTFDYCVLS